VDYVQSVVSQVHCQEATDEEAYRQEDDGDEEACGQEKDGDEEAVVKKDGDEEACGQEKTVAKKRTVVAKSRYCKISVAYGVQLVVVFAFWRKRKGPVRSKGWRRDVFCTLGKRNVVQCWARAIDFKLAFFDGNILHYESLHCCGIADRRTLPR
jgi:hypothetical protein